MNPIIEAAARAICLASGEDPETFGYHDPGAKTWEAFVPHARACLISLAKCNLTPEMKAAHAEAYWFNNTDGSRNPDDQAQSEFRAMLLAAAEEEK